MAKISYSVIEVCVDYDCYWHKSHWNGNKDYASNRCMKLTDIRCCAENPAKYRMTIEEGKKMEPRIPKKDS